MTSFSLLRSQWAALAFVISWTSFVPAYGATISWIGTTGDWTNGSNWNTPAIPGDFDADSDVDGADFVAWQTNFPKATGGTLSTGDADNDGDVDGADFVVWQTNFPFVGSAIPATNDVAVIDNAGISVIGSLVSDIQHFQLGQDPSAGGGNPKGTIEITAGGSLTTTFDDFNYVGKVSSTHTSLLEVAGGIFTANVTSTTIGLSVGDETGANGAVVVSSGTLNTNGSVWVGGRTGTGTGSLTVEGTGELNVGAVGGVGPGIRVGVSPGATGTLTIDGGTTIVNANSTSSSTGGIVIGNGGNGVMNLNGGTVTVNANGANDVTNGRYSFTVGKGIGSTGVLNITGGTLDVTSSGTRGRFIVGGLGGTGTMNMSGGTVNVNGTGTIFIVSAGIADNLGMGSVTISGGTLNANGGLRVASGVAGLDGSLTVVGSAASINVNNAFLIIGDDGHANVAFQLDAGGVSPITQLWTGGTSQVILGGAKADLQISLNALAPQTDIVLIDNQGPNATSGTFNLLDEGAPISAVFGASTYNWTITYQYDATSMTPGSGNDVALRFQSVTSAVVPEPHSMLLAAFGGMILAAAWKRRKQ